LNPKKLAILRDERERIHRLRIDSLREDSLKGRNTEMYRDSNKNMVMEDMI